jgi:hypothetical protein
MTGIQRIPSSATTTPLLGAVALAWPSHARSSSPRVAQSRRESVALLEHARDAQHARVGARRPDHLQAHGKRTSPSRHETARTRGRQPARLVGHGQNVRQVHRHRVGVFSPSLNAASGESADDHVDCLERLLEVAGAGARAPSARGRTRRRSSRPTARRCRAGCGA